MIEIKEEVCGVMKQIARSQNNIANFQLHINRGVCYGEDCVAEFYTGLLKNRETGETTAVAIKKAPIWEFDYTPTFRNENVFYTTIFPALYDLQKRYRVAKLFLNVPKYFCGGLASKKEYVVMEDAKPLGYVMFDKKQYFNKDHLEMIFKIYGKFHALSYVLRQKSLEKYMDVSKNLKNLIHPMTQFIPMAAAISAAVKALDPQKDRIVYEEMQDLGEYAVQTFLKSSSYNGEHKCLVHGDSWSNHMLFKYSELGELLDMKLVDFQLCHENTPIHDLSYFFYSGASKSDFDNLDAYLQIYHQSFFEFAKELGAKPDEVFTLTTLRKEWKEYALSGVLFSIYLWQVKLTPKENFTEVLQPDDQGPSREEKFKQLQGHMDRVHKTDAYRDRTTDILKHAFEYGVLNKNKIMRNK